MVKHTIFSTNISNREKKILLSLGKPNRYIDEKDMTDDERDLYKDSTFKLGDVVKLTHPDCSDDPDDTFTVDIIDEDDGYFIYTIGVGGEHTMGWLKDDEIVKVNKENVLIQKNIENRERESINLLNTIKTNKP